MCRSLKLYQIGENNDLPGEILVPGIDAVRSLARVPYNEYVVAPTDSGQVCVIVLGWLKRKCRSPSVNPAPTS